MTRPTPPCFDVQSRQDCPRRHAGCAATCPEWAKYEKQRKAGYEKVDEYHKATEAYRQVRQKRVDMYRNSKLRYPKKKDYLGGNNHE